MAHRLSGWTAIRYAEKHGGTLKKFTDPIERALARVSIEKAQRVAREDPSLIYMDVKHGGRKKTNPRVKLPTKFTMMPVRVNKKGEVQIGVNPAKLGSGGRFAKCVKSVESRGGAYDPKGVCAKAGIKKYGKRRMASMARAGRKRAARNPRNGYVVYPDSVGKMKLADANREAKRESIDYGKARVENADTEKVVARWEHGRKI